MTLFVVGLLSAVLGGLLGACYGFRLADAVQKTTCTCHTPRKTEDMK